MRRRELCAGYRVAAGHAALASLRTIVCLRTAVAHKLSAATHMLGLPAVQPSWESTAGVLVRPALLSGHRSYEQGTAPDNVQHRQQVTGACPCRPAAPEQPVLSTSSALSGPCAKVFTL